jgi:hypothetical protein
MDSLYMILLRRKKMPDRNALNVFRLLLAGMCIEKPDIVKTSDGLFMVNKSTVNILS